MSHPTEKSPWPGQGGATGVGQEAGTTGHETGQAPGHTPGQPLGQASFSAQSGGEGAGAGGHSGAEASGNSQSFTQSSDLPGYNELFGGQAPPGQSQPGPQAGYPPGTPYGVGGILPGTPYYILVPGGHGGPGMPPGGQPGQQYGQQAGQYAQASPGPLPGHSPGQPGGRLPPPAAGPKEPFRKRHPFIFWGLLVFLFMIGTNYILSRTSGGFAVGGNNIAVVNVEGVILESKDIMEWIEIVRKSPAYKGAVIRVNSPGGAVAPSQELYQAVKRLAAEKPVAISMADMAASGGYYIAVGADKIFASPSTITASIGVKLEVPNLEKLMDTIGVSTKTLTTGRLKDAGSYTRSMSPEEEAYLQELIEDMYLTFIEAVAEGRKMSLDEVRSLADGRAMTGRQALKAKLVDELGTLEDAVTYVAGKAGLSPAQVRVEHGPKKEEPLLKSLIGVIFDLEAEYRTRSQQMVFFY